MKEKEVERVMKYFDDVERISDDIIVVHDYVSNSGVSDFGYLFWWDISSEECGVEYTKTAGSIECDELCKTAEDFINYIESYL